ncbi:MAG: hypothetical protein RRA45_02900 [Saccharolobus sp.]|jgi:hypothetical protein|uniref:hypothetical protein n=1 Tax=Saccharolobus sp. TaxID=2100761 RepID=UPI0028CF2FBB|nr:hypothetical protein [Saccharolobus sp.]MDT7861155.1 hypothetical protein [Saccharolobus sp.]
MDPFIVKLEGKSLKITNNLDHTVKITEVIIKYKVSVNLIDDRIGLKTITENVKIDKELKRKETLQIETKLEDINEISIIYKDDTFRRIDISL